MKLFADKQLISALFTFTLLNNVASQGIQDVWKELGRMMSGDPIEAANDSPVAPAPNKVQLSNAADPTNVPDSMVNQELFDQLLFTPEMIEEMNKANLQEGVQADDLTFSVTYISTTTTTFDYAGITSSSSSTSPGPTNESTSSTSTSGYVSTSSSSSTSPGPTNESTSSTSTSTSTSDYAGSSSSSSPTSPGPTSQPTSTSKYPSTTTSSSTNQYTSITTISTKTTSSQTSEPTNTPSPSPGGGGFLGTIVRTIISISTAAFKSLWQYRQGIFKFVKDQIIAPVWGWIKKKFNF